MTTPGESVGAVDTANKPAAPGPAQLLHVCQAKVAELEGWLDKVKQSLGSEGPSRPMQQAVEQHLAACQVRRTGPKFAAARWKLSHLSPLR